MTGAPSFLERGSGGEVTPNGSSPPPPPFSSPTSWPSAPGPTCRWATRTAATCPKSPGKPAPATAAATPGAWATTPTTPSACGWATSTAQGSPALTGPTWPHPCSSTCSTPWPTTRPTAGPYHRPPSISGWCAPKPALCPASTAPTSSSTTTCPAPPQTRRCEHLKEALVSADGAVAYCRGLRAGHRLPAAAVCQPAA